MGANLFSLGLEQTSGGARPSNPFRIASATFAALAFFGFSRPAAADNVFGVALNYNDVVDEEGTGAGVDLRFGPRLDLALVTLTTELSAGYHDFGGRLDPAVYRGMAGGRLGVGIAVRPSVFAHVGVGHLRYDDVLEAQRESQTDLTWDLGAGLDFTLLPLVDVGVQASYNSLGGDEARQAFEWVQAGAHVTFVFDDG